MQILSLKHYCLAAICGLVSTHSAAVVPMHGVNFTHKDWQLVCDNTNTCRMAGATNNTVALMITRNAGPNQLPTAIMRFADLDNSSVRKSFVTGIKSVTLRVNEKIIGKLKHSIFSGDFLLDELQTAAVIGALKGTGRVNFEVVDYSVVSKKVTLSGQGAYAVFLKADEIQERIGTSAAIIKKGDKDESNVLHPLEAPVVRRVRVPDGVHRGSDENWSLIEKKLVSSLDSRSDCPLLEAADKDFLVYPLSDTQILLSVVCQGHDYFFSDSPSRDYRVGYWVMDSQFLGTPSLVTINANNYGRGLISFQQSSYERDCIEYASWIWDGDKFVPGNTYTQGICHGRISFLGQWKLPTVVVKEIVPEY
jgi:hypothetical protein